MSTIHQLVQQALAQGYLTIDAEQQLRNLVQTTKYSLEDMNAFVNLQIAAKDGHIRQESREKLFND
jgi:dephospho-CoA kinase